NFEFKDQESLYKNTLIAKLGELDHPQAQNFLQNYYRKNSGDSNLQLAVLSAFLQKDDSESFKIVAKLMDEDLPLPSNIYSMNGIFNAFADNSENTSKIMDELLK